MKQQKQQKQQREEEETAKKFGLSGFGSFGADPFAHDEEEEHPEAGGEDEAAEAAEAAEEQPAAGGEEQPAGTDQEADEGVELIATDDDSHQDSTYGTHQDTIVEEEEPEEDTGAADEGDKSHASDAQTNIANTAEDDESSWQETEMSSGATIETEVNKDGTVTEEEEVETIPSSGYSVTGPKDDSRRMSIVSLDDDDENRLSTVTDLALKGDSDGDVRITDFNTETYELEDEEAMTKGRVTTFGGVKDYSTTEDDGTVTTGKASFKASVEEEMTVLKSGGDLPVIEIGGDVDDDESHATTSFSKTTAVEEEEDDTTRTRTTKTTTVTEETETRRLLKQKASIDTHDHEIIIYNKDGVEITRVTHGDVIVGFDKVDEVVMVKNGLLTVSHETGECLVKIVDGEVNVFEFDGEVIVRSLIDVAHKYLVPKKTERKLSIHDIETRDA